MAIIGAIIDVIGAVQPGKQLQDEGRLVGGAAGAVKECALRSAGPQPFGDHGKCLLMIHGAVAVCPRGLVQWMRQPAQCLQLASAQRGEFGDRIISEYLYWNGRAQVARLSLDVLVANLNALAVLVVESTPLPASAKSAGLAGIARPDRRRQSPWADLIGNRHHIPDSFQSAADGGRECVLIAAVGSRAGASAHDSIKAPALPCAHSQPR